MLRGDILVWCTPALLSWEIQCLENSMC
jgi:hypothetical protein